MASLLPSLKNLLSDGEWDVKQDGYVVQFPDISRAKLKGFVDDVYDKLADPDDGVVEINLDPDIATALAVDSNNAFVGVGQGLSERATGGVSIADSDEKANQLAKAIKDKAEAVAAAQAEKAEKSKMAQSLANAQAELKAAQTAKIELGKGPNPFLKSAEPPSMAELIQVTKLL